MKQGRFWASVVLMIFLGGCGSGNSDTNGSLTLMAIATGPTVVATATYTNTLSTNLSGVPINFSAAVGSTNFPVGTAQTGQTGIASIAFAPPAFNGTQTVTVIASAGSLTQYFAVAMTGRSLTVTPPAALTLTTTQAGGTPFPFTIPSSAGFVTITDPFTNDLSGHTIQITASVISSNTADTLTPPSATTTNSAGSALFPGATGTLVVPANAGGVETMTITWTVTDTTTGLTGSGITTVTLTKTA